MRVKVGDFQVISRGQKPNKPLFFFLVGSLAESIDAYDSEEAIGGAGLGADSGGRDSGCWRWEGAGRGASLM